MKVIQTIISKSIFSIFAIVLVFGTATSHAQNFKEGDDYVTLQGDATILPDGRVEVIEFFWFGCPTCFRFEPVLHAWQKPDTINFVTVPGILNRSSEFHAHAYYAMELLNLQGQLMTPFYDELHVKRNRINTVEDFEAWANTQPDVDAAKLAGTVNSFAARTKVAQADVLANKYGITGVPTLVVGGKYRTSPAMADSFARALQVVEYLVAKVLAEQS